MKTIAVIEAGISGLAAAYVLSRRHRVDLFEQERRLGGHTNTVLVEGQNGTVPLDTGFLVHNDPPFVYAMQATDSPFVDMLEQRREVLLTGARAGAAAVAAAMAELSGALDVSMMFPSTPSVGLGPSPTFPPPLDLSRRQRPGEQPASCGRNSSA